MPPELALAVSAGALAAVNPCGFALLPAYLGLFLGEHDTRRSSVARALVVGLAVTAGFVVVFGVMGFAVSALSLALGDWLSYVTIASGVLLLAVGVLLFAGREVSVRLPRARLSVSGSPRGMLAYGVVYATVSLSCTLPVFLAAVVSVFTSPELGVADGVLALLGYAVGMGAVLTVLALALAVFGQSAARRARSGSPYIGRISGVFLVAAGLYVLWYGWVEYQAFRGNVIAAGPVDAVAAASAATSRLLTDVGLVPLVVGALAVVAGAWAYTATRRSRRTASLHPSSGES